MRPSTVAAERPVRDRVLDLEGQSIHVKRFVGQGALIVALLLVLTACGTTEQIDFTGRTVDPPFTVDATELTSDQGEPVTLGPDDGAQQLRLVFFGYTHCPDICPAVLGSLASGLVKLSEDDRDRVQVYRVGGDRADRGQRSALGTGHERRRTAGRPGRADPGQRVGELVPAV